MSTTITSPQSPPEFRASSGGFRVVFSGAMQLFDISNAALYVDDLSFVFQFAKDAGASRIEQEPRGGKSLFLRCWNFNSAFGTGLNSAVKVANIRGSELFLMFTTQLLDEKSGPRLLTYSFYMKEAS